MMIQCSDRCKECQHIKCKFRHTILLDHAFTGGIKNMIERLVRESGYFVMICDALDKNVKVDCCVKTDKTGQKGE